MCVHIAITWTIVQSTWFNKYDPIVSQIEVKVKLGYVMTIRWYPNVEAHDNQIHDIETQSGISCGTPTIHVGIFKLQNKLQCGLRLKSPLKQTKLKLLQMFVKTASIYDASSSCVHSLFNRGRGERNWWYLL